MNKATGLLTTWLIYLLAIASVFGAENTKEKRNRHWLTEYITQSIPDTPRNHRYFALINRELDEKYLGINTKWLLESGGSGYRARRQTNTIGRLAFCYRTRGLRYYQDPEVLEKLRLALLGVAKHVTAEGKFVWPGDTDMYWAGSHEHAWRLEPVLLGYIWVGDELPHKDRQTIEAALQRAADWLVRHPNKGSNNRGAVWCAITTLCGLYYNNQQYLDVVERYADDIVNVAVFKDGEIGEHWKNRLEWSGPDIVYSYTACAYLYLYRLFSGKDQIDQRLLKATRWFAVYNTQSGWPNVVGASVRTGSIDPAIQNTLPMFEHFSHTEPFFATVAEHYLARCERQGKSIFSGKTLSPLIWALFEGGREVRPGPYPDWYVNHTQLYERQQVQYALVSRTYQTGVTFRTRPTLDHNRERLPLRGMQTFAFADEYPILFHTRYMNSTTEADGINTASTDVNEGPNGWEVFPTRGEKLKQWRCELVTIITRHKTLCTVYAYTPVSAVVVYSGATGAIRSRWVMSGEIVSTPTLSAQGGVVSFEGRKGRIYLLTGDAQLSDEGKGQEVASVLEVVVKPPMSAFGFSNDSFRFHDYDAGREELFFSDASGRYRLLLKAVLGSDGHIDRNVSMRLTRIEE